MKKLRCYIKSDYSTFPYGKSPSLPFVKEFNLDDLDLNLCEIGNRMCFLKNKDAMVIFAVPIDNLLFYDVVEVKEKEDGSV